MIAELRGGGEDYINTSNVLLARNIIELIGCLKLGGLGACSPRKILTFQCLELFLVASETKNFRVEKHVASMNTFIRVCIYTIPQQMFWRFRHTLFM